MIPFGHAASNMQIEVLIFRLVARNQFLNNFCPFSIAVGIADLNVLKAAAQTLQVLGQTKDVARINRYHLVHAIAKDEAAIKHRNLGFVDR